MCPVKCCWPTTVDHLRLKSTGFIMYLNFFRYFDVDLKRTHFFTRWMAKLCSCLWVLWGESFRWSTEEGMPFWQQILAWKSHMTGVWCCTLQHQAATSTQSADFAGITTVTVAMNGPVGLEVDSLHPSSLQRAGKYLTVTCSAMITVVIIAPVALRPSEANLVGISTVASWLTPIVYLPTAQAKLTPTC